MTIAKERIEEFKKKYNIHSTNPVLPVTLRQDSSLLCILQEYTIVYASPSFQSFFPQQTDGLSGQDFRHLICPESIADLDRLLSSSTDSESYNSLLKIPSVDDPVILDVNCFSFQLKNNTFTTLLAHEMGKFGKLLEGPYLNSGVLEGILSDMEAIVEIEDVDQTLYFINDTGCKFFGKSQEELIGTCGLDTIYEEDQWKALDSIGQFITPDRPSSDVDLRMYAKDGKLAWVNWTGRALFSSSGEYIGHLSVGRDITARKLAEEELQKLKDQLEERVNARTLALEQANQQLSALNCNINNIYMSIPLGILVADERGTITNRNNYLEQLWGDALVLFTEHLENEIKSARNPYFRRLFRENKSFQDIEMTFPAPQGDFYVLVSAVPTETVDSFIKTAVIIVRPIQEVHKLINRIGGTDVPFQFSDIITQNHNMLQAIETARRASGNSGNVLIMGESGTGKEMFAQAIHNSSGRRRGPFISINCGAIPRELLASELFGYSDGAFTGAKKGGKPGKFELAAGGTIFLDEIGDMPMDQQVSLLRVIQEKKLMRIGDSRVIAVDARIICATNKDLLSEIEKNNFRRDLYYRLNVIQLNIPPLRQRREDIPVLVQHFTQSFVRTRQTAVPQLPEDVMQTLMHYSWPGNVRELQNVIERLFYLSYDQPISLKHLPEEISAAPGRLPANNTVSAYTIADYLAAEKKQQRVEEGQQIMDLLRLHHGNISRVAKDLGIARSTLYAKIRKYNLPGR